MRNRDITFVIRMRNEARQALSGLSGDLRSAAAAAGRAAANLRESAQAAANVAPRAAQAANAVRGMNAAMGGTPGAAARSTNALTGFLENLAATTRQMLTFAAAFAIIGGVQALTGALITQSAAWQMMHARISLVTSSAAEAKAVQEELFQVAQRTYQPTEAVTTLYFRMAQSLNNIGYSQREVITLTEMIGQSMVISGAKTEEAAGALIQFSQGLASNRLSGDELRSVLEQAPALAQAITAGLAKTSPDLVKKYGLEVVRTTGDVTTKQKELMVGALRDAGKAGDLTTKRIVDALLTQVDTMGEKFKTIPMLVPLAFQAVKNAFQKELAEIDAMFNLNGGLGRGLMSLANDVIPVLSSAMQPVADAVSVLSDGFRGIASIGSNLFGSLGIGAADLARAIGSIGTALLIVKGIPAILGMVASALGPMIMPIIAGLGAGLARLGTIMASSILSAAWGLRGAMMGVGVAMGVARGGVIALGAAIMANPLGLLIGAIQLAVMALLMFRDKSVEVGGQTVLVGEMVGEAWDRTVKFIGILFTDLVKFVGAAAKAIADVWQKVTSFLGNLWAATGKMAQSIFSAIAKLAERYITPVLKFLGAIPQWYFNVLKTVWTNIGNFFKNTLNMIGGAAGALNAEWGAAIKDAANKVGGFYDAVGNTMGDIPKMASDVGEKVGEAFGVAVTQGYKITPIGQVITAAMAVAEPVASYLGDRAGQAYGTGFMDAVAQRSLAREIKLAKVGEATPDLNKKQDVQIMDKEDEDKDGKKKADEAKKAEARIREMTNSIKNLAQAYNPYLASLAKEEESQERLDKLIDMAAEGPVEFAAALKRAGMDLKQWETVVWQVTEGIKASEVDDFLQRFTTGGDAAARSAKRMKDQLFFDKLSAVAAKGGEPYIEMLKTIGWNADQARTAIEQFKAGFEVQEASDFFSKYAENMDEAKAAQDRAMDASVAERLIAARDKGGQVWIDLLDQLKVSAEQADVAIKRFQSGGASTSEIDAAKSALGSFMEAYNPLVSKKMEDAAISQQIIDLERLRASNTGAFEEALKKLGVTYEEYLRSLERARGLMADQPGVMESAKGALEDYTANIQKNGMTLKSAFTNAFKGMEDALVSFVTTGKLDFKAMVDSMIADLVRLFAQQMAMKIALAVFGAQDGGTFGSTPFAKGGAFEKVQAFAKGDAFSAVGPAIKAAARAPVQAFAKGDAFANKVFGKPTMFEFAKQGQRKLGVMGEAGPEAVVPLRRDRGRMTVTAYGDGAREQVPLRRGPDGRLGIDREAMRQSVTLFTVAERGKASDRREDYRRPSQRNAAGKVVYNNIVQGSKTQKTQKTQKTSNVSNQSMGPTFYEGSTFNSMKTFSEGSSFSVNPANTNVRMFSGGSTFNRDGDVSAPVYAFNRGGDLVSNAITHGDRRTATMFSTGGSFSTNYTRRSGDSVTHAPITAFSGGSSFQNQNFNSVTSAPVSLFSAGSSFHTHGGNNLVSNAPVSMFSGGASFNSHKGGDSVTHAPVSFFSKGGTIYTHKAGDVSNTSASLFAKGGSFGVSKSADKPAAPVSFFAKGTTVTPATINLFAKGGSFQNQNFSSVSNAPVSMFAKGGSFYTNHSNSVSNAPVSMFAKGGSFYTKSAGDVSNVATSLFSEGSSFYSSSPVTAFAKGSEFVNRVYNSPTFFQFSRKGQKRLGVMGEAGPEAIMPLKGKGTNLTVTAFGPSGAVQVPLKRGPDGRLGIDRDTFRASEAFAKGGAFAAPVEAFAKGSSFMTRKLEKEAAKTFSKARGKSLGVMGQNAPEAVVPLRLKQGKLTVTAYGKTGSEQVPLRRGPGGALGIDRETPKAARNLVTGKMGQDIRRSLEAVTKSSSFTNRVVNKSTFFEYAKQGQRKLGVMGEAGPEAIMPLRPGRGGMTITAYGQGVADQIPLKRGPDGRLGIDREAMTGAKAFAKGEAMGTNKPFSFSPASALSPGATRSVMPAGANGGGGDRQFVFAPNVNVTVEGGGGGDRDQQDAMGMNLSSAVVQSLKGMVLEVINNEKRPGGSLAA